MNQEPTTAELMFEQFRKQFPLIKVYVEGNTMRYSFQYDDKKMLEGWKILAESIIDRLGLPLTVTTQRGVVPTLPMLLILTYNENDEKKSTTRTSNTTD